MQKELSTLSDQELLEMAKKAKSNAYLHAALIGFLIGVIVFSVVKSTWGLFTLIPLYFIYKLLKTPQEDTASLDEELSRRGLK